jgi:hypothetical protein
VRSRRLHQLRVRERGREASIRDRRKSLDVRRPLGSGMRFSPTADGCVELFAVLRRIR